MSAEVRERAQHLVVGEVLDEAVRAVGVLAQERAAQERVALEQRELELVVGQHLLEELAQRLAAARAEELLAERAVTYLQHAPAVRLGRALDAIAVPPMEPLLVRHARAVEVLAVVVDDPGHVPEQALGDVGHRLEQGSLAELRVADQRPEVRALRHVAAVVARIAVREREIDRRDRRDADRARRQEVERVGIRARVVALEDRLFSRERELPEARHDLLRLVGREPGGCRVGRLAAWVAPEQLQQMVAGMVDRRRVRLAAHEVDRLAREEVQRAQDVDRAGARGRMATYLGVAAPLVRAMVGGVDHHHRLRERAIDDPREQGDGRRSDRFESHLSVLGAKRGLVLGQETCPGLESSRIAAGGRPSHLGGASRCGLLLRSRHRRGSIKHGPRPATRRGARAASRRTSSAPRRACD